MIKTSKCSEIVIQHLFERIADTKRDILIQQLLERIPDTKNIFSFSKMDNTKMTSIQRLFERMSILKKRMSKAGERRLVNSRPCLCCLCCLCCCTFRRNRKSILYYILICYFHLSVFLSLWQILYETQSMSMYDN